MVKFMVRSYILSLMFFLWACSHSQAQVYIHLTMDQPPKLELVMGDDESICPGDSVQLMATFSGGKGPFTFQWQPVEGLSNPDILDPMASPEASTKYRLTVSDSNSCTVTDSQWVVVEICEGIDQNARLGGWKIFPNPGSGAFELINSGSTPHSIKGFAVLDNQGRSVHFVYRLMDQDTYSLTTQAAPGHYLLKVSTDRREFYVPLIIQ